MCTQAQAKQLPLSYSTSWETPAHTFPMFTFVGPTGPKKKWGVTARGLDGLGAISRCLLADKELSLVLLASCQAGVWEGDEGWQLMWF